MTIKLGYDAGHGGYKDKVKNLYTTPGKRTPDGEPEWEFNNTVASAFAAELSKYVGIELKRFDDPTGKTDVLLNNRTKQANAWGAQYYISFHHNAVSGTWNKATGIETHVYTYPSVATINFANAVHPALEKGYGLRDRGIKKNNLAICRDIHCASILLEGGFMDSTIDIEVLRDKAKLQNAGILLAQAVAKHLKLTLKKIEKKEDDSVKLNATARNEAIAEIKAAVKDGRFTSKHENVEKYSDDDLVSYSLVALLRKK